MPRMTELIWRPEAPRRVVGVAGLVERAVSGLVERVVSGVAGLVERAVSGVAERAVSVMPPPWHRAL
ncbi:hypothetical protein BIV03_10070 [Curtobacterium sp. MCBA15_016]|nr:hypothetical protein BIV03_10070 [Curtobacterium sp. MCBA15_016]